MRGFDKDFNFTPRSTCCIEGWGAVIGIAAGGIAAGVGSAVAGSEAAGATTSAANTASQEQEWAIGQGEQLSQPYRQVGTSAIPQLESLLGISANGAPVNNANTLKALQQTPGYQFTQQQGNQGTLNAAAGAGMLNSGNTLEALDQFNSGLADQTYQQAVGDTQNAVGIGQAAAAGTAANIGAGATNLGNIAVNQGNTLASIDANEIAGITGAIGNTTNNAMMYNTLAGLQNPAGGGGGGGVYNIGGYQITG